MTLYFDSLGLYLLPIVLFISTVAFFVVYRIYYGCPRDSVATIVTLLYEVSFIINTLGKQYDGWFAARKEDGTMVNQINFLEIIVDPVTMAIIYCSLYMFIFELKRIRLILKI